MWKLIARRIADAVHSQGEWTDVITEAPVQTLAEGHALVTRFVGEIDDFEFALKLVPDEHITAINYREGGREVTAYLPPF